MNDISPKAEIDPRAKIGQNCKIFPFVYIEGDVEIGDNCIIFPFVSILNGTRMGGHNKVHQGSVIGALPQDFNFRGEKSECIIGENNIIRENVVINRATHRGGKTVIGDDNVLMEGAHIFHDTKMGNNCVVGYGTKIAGDCKIGNGVIFSSSVIENAGTRVGDRAMIQAGATFSSDIPPYVIVNNNGQYGGVNKMMCQFDAIEDKVIKHIGNAYRLVFHGQTSMFDAVNQVREQIPDSEEIQKIVSFLSETTKGIVGKK